MKRVLSVFSYVFHPLFIPLFALLFYLYAADNYLVPAEKLLMIIQVVIITVLIPIAFFFLLRSMGKIESVMAKKLKERQAPLIMQAILIIVIVRQGFMAERLPDLHFFFLAVLLSTILALVFLLCKMQISLHMMGMGGLLFFVIMLSYIQHLNLLTSIAFLFLMTGFVASSRLKMGAHSETELIIGFLCGVIPQVLLPFIFRL